MSSNIVQFNEEIIKGQIKELVRGSVEEALIEMYPAGVSVRRVEDITEALWGSKVSASTISELNKNAYVNIEAWRNRPLQGGKYPYVYVDGIYLKRNWGGEYENVAVLVAIAVNEDGYREVLGAAEGMKEEKASWVSFFRWLRGRGLEGVPGEGCLCGCRAKGHEAAGGCEESSGSPIYCRRLLDFFCCCKIRKFFWCLEFLSIRSKVKRNQFDFE